jgi:hypothetical protein
MGAMAGPSWSPGMLFTQSIGIKGRLESKVDWNQFMRALLLQTRRQLASFKPQDLANTAWAMANMGHQEHAPAPLTTYNLPRLLTYCLLIPEKGWANRATLHGKEEEKLNKTD